MNRRQREAELRMLLTTQRGKEEILSILKEHAGLVEGNLPPFGTLLVDTILNYEHPPEQETEPQYGYEAEEADPLDIEFAEPPAMESLGG
jgi:hypothetical protein